MKRKTVSKLIATALLSSVALSATFNTLTVMAEAVPASLLEEGITFSDTTEEEGLLPESISSTYGEDSTDSFIVNWQIRTTDPEVKQYIEYTDYADVNFRHATREEATSYSFELLFDRAALENDASAMALFGNTYEEQMATLDEVEAECEDSEYKERMVYYVIVEGLDPDTRYRYRVGSDENGFGWSAFYSHWTSSGKADDSFTFGIFSDPQTSSESEDECYANMSLALKSLQNDYDLDFLAIGGDMSDNASNEIYYTSFYNRIEALERQMPVITVPGNHETLLNARVLNRLTNYKENFGEMRAYDAYFKNPENGMLKTENITTCMTTSETLNSTWYFYYNGTLFIGLSCSLPAAELTLEQQWLDSVLQADENKEGGKADHIIVMMHKGVYGNYYYGSTSDMYNRFTPIFEKYAVDLVMSGHDHTYFRSKPVNADGEVDYASGTVYTIVGSTGPKLNTAKDGANRQKQIAVSVDQQPTGIYSAFTVSKSGIEVTVKYLDGTVIDRYTISRDIDEDVKVSVSAGTTSALIDVSMLAPREIEYFQIERINGEVIVVLSPTDKKYLLAGLKPNSSYQFSIRVVYTNGYAKVIDFSVQTEGGNSLFFNTSTGALTAKKEGASGYYIWVNNIYKDDILINTPYLIENYTSAGNYLIRVEYYDEEGNIFDGDYLQIETGE